MIVVDASLSTKVGTELRRRGRKATSLAELGLDHLEDEPMLAEVRRIVAPPYVLLTADDAMPAVHAEVIGHTMSTVATLDARWEQWDLTHEQYKFEVVQRWAHKMAEQPQCTVVRYSLAAYRRWTRPKGR